MTPEHIADEVMALMNESETGKPGESEPNKTFVYC